MPVPPGNNNRKRLYHKDHHKECEIPPKDVRFPQTTVNVEIEAVLVQLVVEEDTARREHQGQGMATETDDVEDDHYHRVSVKE